jgi:hypothetical protein
MTNIPRCYACVHFDWDAPRRVFRCDAFPNGIPVLIQANKHDHSRPHPGHHGIRFEQIRPGPLAEVAVQAVLERAAKPDTRAATSIPAESRKSKGRRRIVR